ncbi:RNA dependent RNA polymerase-domain-containing protein [Dichotomocladium elegans]|nr:RNA dependent RNA polymerase-domain-containing protein [Dichotomocladium elegans]
MLDDPNTAIRTLTENVDEFGTALSMIRIIQAGFLEKRDPYILNLLNMFRSSMLKDLKKKAKILVPEGAFLLGVMDETKTLGEGQVFCQISMADGKGSSTKVIEGEVVVFRNPCFHPGDIRVVQAVNSPKLKHLCDVLVFSSQGYRDIPSMCSGGDLDGDDYTIFWDRELIPPKKNYEPMNYKAPKPPEVVDVRISDIKKFFVNYINNDNLGQIANAHLATADASPNGALDGNCLRLAQLHSLAVDFPKSGRPAKFESNLRVKKFPDFMQKKDKEMYESSKILGQIYRGIDKSDYKDYKDQIVDNTLYDVRLRVEGIERYVAEARVLKAEYDKDVFALMNQYGVQTEAELLSGYVVKWLKKGSRKSTHELQKQTMAAVEALKNKWKKRFEAEFIQDGPNSDQTAALEAKASAWYYVTYHADEQCRNLTLEGKALSFPWVIYEHICDIAQKNNNCVAREDRARPVDDELVQKYAQQTKGKQPFKYSVIYENEALSEDDDDGEEEEEEEDVVTEVLSLDYLPLQQQQQHHVTRNEVGDAANHLLISANATEEDLANALLS